MPSTDGKSYLADVAGNARKDIESKTGKSVISHQNAKSLGRSHKPQLPETE